MLTPIVAVRDLSVQFGSGPQAVPAISDISLEIYPQEFISVVGPSGCGKSTLLRVLAGLATPTTGQVLFDGEALGGPGRRIGVVFQQPNLMPWRTVLDNIALPLELAGRDASTRRARAQALVDLVGLQGFEQHYPAALSGGMAQRVAIARALVHQPDLLLLDEPLGALDALTRERMWGELRRIWQQRPTTVLMVTHDINEAVFLADRVMVLTPRPGRVCAHIPVTLPAQRDLSMIYAPEFGQMAARVRESINREGAC